MTARTRPDEPRPTRRALLDLLAGSPAGMTAAELAAALGLHPNGVRKQLQALVRDGAVGAERVVSGRRGRPAVRYRAADARRETAVAQQLAAMLVELLDELEPDEAKVEEFGRRQAARIARSPDGRAALLGTLTAMGFSPRETTAAADSRAGRLEVVLGHCPFAGAVSAAGGRFVCILHRGLSRGLAQLTPGGRLTEFDILAPENAGCRLTAEGLSPPGF